MKTRVYTDTSVFGGCLDEEFSVWSRKFFEEARRGLRTVVVSDLTRLELEPAPGRVREVLERLPAASVETVRLGREAAEPAEAYREAGAVGPDQMADALHIATASVERVDVLVSWNFRHIVNLERIRVFNAVNLRMGYPVLEVRSPREVLHEEDL